LSPHLPPPHSPPLPYTTLFRSAVRATRDLAARVDAFQRGCGIGVDHEAAVLVMEDREGEDPLLERVDAGAAVAAKHVRERDVGIDRKSTRLNSSHEWISYAVFC